MRKQDSKEQSDPQDLSYDGHYSTVTDTTTYRVFNPPANLKLLLQ